MKSLRINQRFTNKESNSFKHYLNEISQIKMFTPEEELEYSLKASNGDKKATEELIKRNLRFVVSVAKQYETPNVDIEDLINEGNIGLMMAVQNYKPNTGFKFITYAVFWIRKLILEYLAKHSRLVRIPSNKVNGISKLNQYVNQLEQKLGKNVDISELIDEYGSEISKEEISELQNLSMFTFDSLDNPVNDADNSLTLGEIISDKSIDPSDYLVSSQFDKKVIDKLLNNLKPRDKKIMISLFGLDGSAPLTLKEVSDEVGLTREMVRQIRKKSLDKLKNYCFQMD
jgi:RNA polymerase primary sigma factor